MNAIEFDRENVELMSGGHADVVERRLLDKYEIAKSSQDTASLLQAISSLAHFYSLPFKEDLAKAEQYFRERFAILLDAESALELVMFYYYSLGDPRKTLDGVARVRSLTDKGNASDNRLLYTALAVEGLAHLDLAQEQDATRNLEELLDLAMLDPDNVPFGDEFNFLEQLAQRNLGSPTGKRLLDIALLRVRSEEYRERFDKLLQSQAWDTSDQ